MPPVSSEALAELEARQLAFLRARLVSPRAEAEWRENVTAVFADFLAAKVRDIVEPRALAAALDSALTVSMIDQAARPIGARVLPLVLRELSAERGKVGERVPVVTRRKIEELLARPAVLPDRALRELGDQEAVQQVMRDVLYDGLKEFSEKVNPFIADWGIPALLKRMSVFGGAMTKGLESVRGELDKRMEPEIQRFLTGFTKKGLRRMIDGMITRGSDPASIALRRHMLAWVLEQELGALTRELDAEAIALGQDIVMDIVAAELAREERRTQRVRLLEEALTAAGDRTVGEILADLGVTFTPDLPAIAAATWPLARTMIQGPAVTAWLTTLVHEFFEEERRALS